MSLNVRPAVFKTVCGALLRRPGWVRFPSIPASFGTNDSQADSDSREPRRMQVDGVGPNSALDAPSLAPSPTVRFTLRTAKSLRCLAPAASRGETIQDRHRVGVEANVGGGHVLHQVLQARGAGYQQDVGIVG